MADLSAALDAALDRLERSLDGLAAARAEGLLPFVTEEGRWWLVPARALDQAHVSWTGGFVAGQLWLAACLRGSERLAAEARAVVELLAPRAEDRTTHDLGFLFWPSAVLGYRATGDAWFRDVGLRAARTLGGRLLPAGVIQALGDLDDPEWRGRTIVDTMPNLALLWWAEREGLAEAGAVARSHARRTAEAYFREDGSTYHGVRFAEDGPVVDRYTIQGYAAESTWTRGQAWAVLGFADAWRATGEAWARELAERAGDTFLRRLSANLVPPWDFDAPPGGPNDASAGAIAAAGLLRLGDGRARPLLEALTEQCLNRGNEDGLLLESCWHYPRGRGVRGATAWGDFFLLDALAHAVRPERRLVAPSR